MYSVSQRSQSVFQNLEVYFQSNVKWDGGVLKSQKSLIVDYANTTNIEFIVDLKVLFYSWLIYSYLLQSWSSDCQGSVQIGSMTTFTGKNNRFPYWIF